MLCAPATSPLLSIPAIIEQVQIERMRANTVAVTCGCFDVLHAGHVNLLRMAAELCDTVIVALDTDDRVRRLKGTRRPINALEARAAVIGSIRHVSYVTSFAWPEEFLGLMYDAHPDLLVIGEDHRENPVGAHLARQVLFAPRIDSSSRINSAMASGVS